MEKQGVVKPGITRPMGDQHEKQAATDTPADRIERLDNDFTKAAANAVTETLGKRSGS